MKNYKKEIKRYEVEELRPEKRNLAVTLKFNEDVYLKFKKIMKEQGLAPSLILNQFMKLTNDLLTSQDGGEVCFIFKPKKEEVER
jgi:ABC-type branched-subunit amino acid transport system substrate-binding protein